MTTAALVACACPANAQVENLTTGQSFQSIAEALRAASPFDELLADEQQFQIESLINLTDVPVTLRSTGAIVQPAGFEIRLTPDAVLEAADGKPARFGGLLLVPADNPTTVKANGLALEATGVIDVDPFAWLAIGSPSNGMDGLLNLRTGALAEIDGDLFIGDGQRIRALGDRATLRLELNAQAIVAGAFLPLVDGLLAVQRNQIANANTSAAVLTFGDAVLGGGLDFSLLDVTPQAEDRFRLIEASALGGSFGVSLMPGLGGNLRFVLRATPGGIGTQLDAVVEQAPASPSFDPPEITSLPTTPSDAGIGAFIGPLGDLVVTAPSATPGAPGSVVLLRNTSPLREPAPALSRRDIDAILSGESPESLGFAPVSETPVGVDPVALTIGDFNAPSSLDVAVVNKADDTMTILLGNGEGGFTQHALIPTGNGPNDVSTADLDADGDLDLIVANEFDGTIMIFANDGDANFTLSDTILSGDGRPKSADPSEVDGDGRTDIVVTESLDSLRAVPDGQLTVLRNNGMGGFEPAVTFAAGFDPFSADVADLNLDGRPDVVVGNRGLVAQPDGSMQSELSIFVNTSSPGQVQFQPSVQAPVGLDLTSLAAADFDGDSDADIAFLAGEPRELFIFRNDTEIGGVGGVVLADIQPIQTTTEPFLLTAGDLTGDGVEDLVVIGAEQLRTGNSTIEAYASLATLLGDLNGDGAVNGADLGLLLGAWGAVGSAADLNGDGVVDGADLGLLLGAWSS